MRFVRAIVLIAISVLAPLTALADGDTGGIRGVVREYPRKATAQVKPVAGATVTLWDGHTETVVKTDVHGFYVIFGLTPGLYEMTANDGAFTTNPILSERDVCVHADSVQDVNLFVVPALIADYDYDYAIRQRYLERFQPDASQSADVYNIGDC